MHTLTLTFDNGPTPGITGHVLDVLAGHGLRATFFVIGQRVAAGPAERRLIERAHAEGHWIGNHTYSHTTPLGAMTGPNVPKDEIARTDDLIANVAHPDRLFRPYGGGGRIGPWLLSPACVGFLQAHSHTAVLWNAVPRDWEDPDGWFDRALGQIEALDWPLLVLHDIASGAMARLDAFLKEVAQRGFTFVQDFPPDCVPIRRGIIQGDISPFVASPS